MKIELKYGCNPHQIPASAIMPDPSPLQILNGTPGYINLLDALGVWQLAKELRIATGKPGAASFKHTSPAGAAIAGSLTETYKQSQFITSDDLSPLATAYIRARGGDRMSSFSDVVGVSDIVDVSLANILRREVTDLIIAPGFEPEALDILKRKRKGQYLILQIDPDYEPPTIERRELYGITMEQRLQLNLSLSGNRWQRSAKYFRISGNLQIEIQVRIIGIDDSSIAQSIKR